jgi:hypothetical protein
VRRDRSQDRSRSEGEVVCGSIHAKDWYHTFVLGTLAMYHDVKYRVEFNREAGPDVRIIPNVLV